MGHADGKCVPQSFKEAMNGIHFCKMLQVSIDGPAVNWKFLDLLTNDDESGNGFLWFTRCAWSFSVWLYS